MNVLESIELSLRGMVLETHMGSTHPFDDVFLKKNGDVMVAFEPTSEGYGTSYLSTITTQNDWVVELLPKFKIGDDPQPVGIGEFLMDNDELSYSEKKKILNLKRGEYCYIDITKIQRI